MGELDLSVGRLDAGSMRQHVLKWAQHQGQRCAELMAHVGEEGGFGAVDFGQGGGATALLLISANAGKTGCDLSCEQPDEGAQVLVSHPVGIQSDDHEARSGPVLRLLRDRHDQRRIRRLVPGSLRHGAEA